jgi:small subunit ribosomal protein S2e
MRDSGTRRRTRRDGSRARNLGRSRGRRGESENKWKPCTKLGRLVNDGKIKSLEQIYLHSIRIKEHQILDKLLGDKLKVKAIKQISVKKQTCAGQRTRIKVFVIVGDYDGHVGLGVKSAKEGRVAHDEAEKIAKTNVIPVRRGYWGNKIGKAYTLPIKVTGKCGSVLVRLIPAPQGAGIVAAHTAKTMLQMAGIQDVYTCSRGHTATLGNFAHATYYALAASYGFLSPDLWLQTPSEKLPMQEL